MKRITKSSLTMHLRVKVAWWVDPAISAVGRMLPTLARFVPEHRLVKLVRWLATAISHRGVRVKVSGPTAP